MRSVPILKAAAGKPAISRLQRALLLMTVYLLNGAVESAPSGCLENGQKLLGNNRYPAICYSGHRRIPRSVENTPTVEETKEDLRMLHAMGIRLLRTYNTAEFPHSARILQAIRELKTEQPGFEMYVMLGAWIQCRNAFREGTDHSVEDAAWNQKEIETAIRLANTYPGIVKIIAVGNETMVTWQAHYVPAATILKWVNVLRDARANGCFPAETLITTSDNWAALGGQPQYRNPDLVQLIRQVDFLSLHTYAFHDTYYDPDLQWGPPADERDLPVDEQLARSVERAIDLQKAQYNAVKNYLNAIGVEKEIHIGETGWASLDNAQFGDAGTRAAGEYTQKLFYDALRKWTRKDNLTCFYFEGFDEPWKSKGTAGSEGHLGLFTVDGQAKYLLWGLVDRGVFKGLERGGNPVRKTHGGDLQTLLKTRAAPRVFKHH